MDYSASFHISATGMATEKLRLDVTAANLANMHSTAASINQLYKPLRVVSKEEPLSFSQQFAEGYSITSGGTKVVSVTPLSTVPRMVYEPGHPHAARPAAGHVHVHQRDAALAVAEEEPGDLHRRPRHLP